MEQKKSLPNKILVVDDDVRTLDSVRLILDRDYEVLTSTSGEEALKVLSKDNIDLVFLDISFSGGMDGMDVLRKIKQNGDNTSVVMLTATNTADVAVQAMKLGAFDYVTKPFNPEEISIIAQKVIENHRLLKEVDCYRSQLETVSFDHIVGKSKKMRQAYELIWKVSRNDATVIISGESGTGKELVARAIHYNSPRKDKPLLVLNCAVIPENLVETELFGYEKGAFTGADSPKPGKFELANEGTIFLDEISALRLDMQAKLLRVLQEKEIERVGGVRTIKVDIRIICATNIDLKKAVAQKKFRQDLYYRLNVVPIHLVPLWERREDIPLLVEHFLKIFNKRFHKDINAVSKEAMEYLINYSWPGNIRELENMMERLVVLADKPVIQAKDLPFDIFLEGKSEIGDYRDNDLGLKKARDNFEKDYITAVLKKAGWNQTEAARLLGIHRNTLIMKLEQLGIEKSKDV